MYATDLMTWKKKSFCGRARTVFATSLASSVSLACSRSNRAYREMSARIVPGDARLLREQARLTEDAREVAKTVRARPQNDFFFHVIKSVAYMSPNPSYMSSHRITR